MFTVYKITNNINNKCYIGSSIRVEKRWQDHKNDAFNSNDEKYDYPLYQAFRKYGLENFSFEILKNDFSSAYDMEEYELEMIDYYDSYNSGYNQTRFTHCSILDPKIKQQVLEKRSQKCAKVDLNENILEIYSSYQDAGRRNGYNNGASTIRNVCKGKISSINGEYFRDLDENNQVIHQDIKSYKNRKPIVGILLSDSTITVYAESILQASQIFKIDRSSIQKCLDGSNRYTTVGGYIWRKLDEKGNIIENGQDIDKLIFQYKESHPLINGERHTISEWCKIYNITRNTVYNRMKKGMNLIEAITSPKRK